MESLVESRKYVAINTTDTTTYGFFVILFTPEAYTLWYNTAIDGKIITAGELVVKSQYFYYLRVNTNLYWNQQPKQHIIKVPTRKILHPQLEVSAVTDFHSIPTSVCTRTQAKKSISIQPLCLTDSD